MPMLSPKPKPLPSIIRSMLGLSGQWMIQKAETGVITIVPITFLAICKDCKANVGMMGAWCMLKNSVWKKTWPGTAQKSRYTKMPMKHNLCIGCIEKRLGRRLKRCDFALNDPHNNVRGKRVGGYSRRLRDRLRG